MTRSSVLNVGQKWLILGNKPTLWLTLLIEVLQWRTMGIWIAKGGLSNSPIEKPKIKLSGTEVKWVESVKHQDNHVEANISKHDIHD